jgi:glycosyltransferase involved in cell wall biosynthesis
VLGETHPVVRRRSGEAYRTSLATRVADLGLTEHVRFYNQYLNDAELVEYLMATDVLLVLNQNLRQYCSGTLAYAVGCGRAVVATPFVYAKELLDSGRGSIVGQRDSAGISSAVNEILGDPDHKAALEAAAYAYGRQMQWPVVASQYLDIYDRITSETATWPVAERPDSVARGALAASQR